MNGLFEKTNSLNTPVECFVFNAENGAFPVKPHWHYFAEFIYMLDGTAEMHSDDDVFTARKGDFIIFHPSSVHSVFPADGSLPKYAVLKFDINKFNLTPAYAPKFRDIFRHARKNGMNIFFESPEADRLDCGRIFSSCVSEMNVYKYGRDFVIQTEIYGLLMNVIRFWISKGMTVERRGVQGGDDYSIENITEYIDLSLCDNLRIGEIAEQCSLSYSCFAKKFREQYGMSCKQYIERMRIYKAEEFLLFTDFDLNYISQETGFSDCSHLIKSFKKYRGVTPKQFRMNRQR